MHGNASPPLHGNPPLPVHGTCPAPGSLPPRRPPGAHLSAVPAVPLPVAAAAAVEAGAGARAAAGPFYPHPPARAVKVGQDRGTVQPPPIGRRPGSPGRPLAAPRGRGPAPSCASREAKFQETWLPAPSPGGAGGAWRGPGAGSPWVPGVGSWGSGVPGVWGPGDIGDTGGWVLGVWGLGHRGSGAHGVLGVWGAESAGSQGHRVLSQWGPGDGDWGFGTLQFPGAGGCRPAVPQAHGSRAGRVAPLAWPGQGPLPAGLWRRLWAPACVRTRACCTTPGSCFPPGQ